MTERIKIEDWDKYYRDEEVEEMPWFTPDLDHDLEAALEERNISSGTILDVGTGPGTQACNLAERGLTVTATDISQAAVEKARVRSEAKGLSITFRQEDILKSRIENEFNYLFDRGCFHVLNPSDRKEYALIAARLLKPGGILFLKCFSYKEPGTDGPHRLTPDEIHDSFAGQFHVESIEESYFRSNHKTDPLALFCVLRKKQRATVPGP